MVDVRRLRVAAGYEILAGLVGLAFTFRLVPLSRGYGLGFNVVVAAFAATSVLLGVFLWQGSARARRLSLVFQLLQILRVSSSSIVLGLLVGVEGTVRFQGPLVSLFTNAGVIAAAFRPTTEQPTIVGINLVAGLVAFLLWRGGRDRGLLARHTTD